MAVVPATTLTETTPLPVPKPRLNVNQGALSLTLQLSVPPPVLLMLTVWVAGLALPCSPRWPAARLAGARPVAVRPAAE
jgi:hypothetical protein